MMARTVTFTRDIKPAQLLRSSTHRLPGQLLVTEYFFRVPLNHANPIRRPDEDKGIRVKRGAKDTGKEQVKENAKETVVVDGAITLFARLATNYENPIIPPTQADRETASQKPFLVYLEGGPGFGNRQPQDHPITRFAIARGYQVLYLDYRGTGLSTPVTSETVGNVSDARAQADYLKHFRADSIVMDLEAVRLCLTASFPEAKKTWSIFGQSFGGFVCLTYLSYFASGLREVFISGGLAPIEHSAEDVYKALKTKVIERNEVYYNKYPEDRIIVYDLVTRLQRSPVAMPAGGTLNGERMMCMGISFGEHGGIDTVHSMVLRMRADYDQFQKLTRPTLAAMENLVSFDSNPIYALLHESIYNHSRGMSSNWAAYEVMKKELQFSWLKYPNMMEAEHKPYEQPLYFAGEMIFPFFFDTYPELRAFKEAAMILAAETQWESLYRPDVLKHNTVPVYAASFINDMYVDYGFAKETASNIQGIKTFETNAMYHNAIRAKTDEVLHELFALRDDTID